MAQTNHTVITDYRRELLCRITSGAISTLPPVSHIAFGDGGVGEDDRGACQGEGLPPQTVLHIDSPP